MAILVAGGLWLMAYLLGSTPTGFLVAKWVKGIDIRQHGSGSTGATNVLRTVGKPAAIAVLLIDLLKGVLAVLMVRALLPWLATISPALAPLITAQPWIEMGAALMVLLGHSRSVWLKFTGGKSAASGLGVLLALAWPVGLGAMAAFILVIATSRMVSLGSMVAAVTGVALMFITQQPLAYGLLAIAGGGYVILRHRSNIERILSGTEPRLGRPSNVGSTESP